MACEVVTVPGAVFALWGKPTVTDMDRVVEEVEATAQRCGHPVVYVARVPSQAPAPDASARARLDKLMPRFREATGAYHVVLEGEGFGAALKRGVVASIFQFSWRGKTFFVHASVSEVLRHVSSTDQRAATALLAAATQRGLLTKTL
jgi:hypothetical protein